MQERGGAAVDWLEALTLIPSLEKGRSGLDQEQVMVTIHKYWTFLHRAYTPLDGNHNLLKLFDPNLKNLSFTLTLTQKPYLS